VTVKYPYETLPDNLAAFCAILRREHRFLIGPRELADAARALEITSLADEPAVRNTLRPILSASAEDARSFDVVFDRFFLGREQYGTSAGDPLFSRASDQDTRPPAAGKRVRNDAPELSENTRIEAPPHHVLIETLETAEDESTAGLLGATYSPLDGEGAMPDLVQPDESWREAAAALVRRIRAGSSRRWRPAPRGQRFDLRRTLRSSLPVGGEMLMPHWRVRRQQRPRFVLLIDGSRSMTARVAPALQMAVALSSVAPGTETFVFSTALRRVTHDARRAAAGEPRRLHLHRAWGGGTTIGACLGDFLRTAGERLLGRDTVVMIWSDGLDVGDPELLRNAMAHLARQAATLVWLNPLLDSPGYEPTALGMRVARPFVTILSNVSDPAGLHRLSRVMRVA
jgi:uncharacterized protein with von Willebrand factor type A (vWA) domain